MGLVPRRKGFCLFLPDVVCSYVKSEKSGIMNRCLKCPFYFKFLREMEEEEEEFFDEVDRIRKYGYSGRRE